LAYINKLNNQIMEIIGMKKLTILAMSLLYSTNSFAGWSTSAGEVTKVYSHDGAHVIRTAITDDVCNAGSFWWPADDSDANDMFSLALAALMSGKNIQVVYDESDLNCNHGNSAKITHMAVIK
jgi:hypothetical protein